MIGKLFRVIHHAWRGIIPWRPAGSSLFSRPLPLAKPLWKKFGNEEEEKRYIKVSPPGLTDSRQPTMADQLEHEDHTAVGGGGRSANNEEELQLSCNIGYVLEKLMQASRNGNTKQVRLWNTFIESYNSGNLSIGERYVEHNTQHHAASRSITQHHAASRSITQHHAASRSIMQQYYLSLNSTSIHVHNPLHYVPELQSVACLAG